MTAAATPTAMPGAKCGHRVIEVSTVGELPQGLTRRCVRKSGHAGNHTMETAGTAPVDSGFVPPAAQPIVAAPGEYRVVGRPTPLPAAHDRSATQDAAAALEVAAKVGRISSMRFVLTVEERRLAAQLHDLIVGRVGSTALAVGELAPPAAPPP